MIPREKVRLNAFFVELILVILFFSISITVVLQMFAAAEQKSRESAELTMAVLQAQDAAERVKTARSVQEAGDKLGAARQEEDAWILEYGDGWSAPAEGEPQYLVVVTIFEQPSQAGRLAKWRISVQKQNNGIRQELYQLDGQAYQGGDDA